jgi:hypothetical protein
MMSALLSRKSVNEDSVAIITGRGGELMLIDCQGSRRKIPFLTNWLAKQATVARGGRIVVAAENSGHWAVWSCSPNQPWSQTIDPQTEEVRLLGASDSHVSIAVRGEIFVHTSFTRTKVANTPPHVWQIREGHSGVLWALAGKSRFGGYPVYRHAPDERTWKLLPPPASGLQIAPAPDSTAWCVNSRGELWRIHPSGAGNFAECSQNVHCSNCRYSPQSVHILNASDDGAGTLWFIAGGDGAADVGYFSNIGRRTTKRFEIDFAPIWISATAGDI